MIGKVYLIGAGPGDPGLITVKGLEVLRKADVIVYDHLASETLLNETRPEAEWLDAGKFAGNHHMKQDEIENVMIDRAKQGKMVARLKGGDPFIFGRGGEEAVALSAAGVPFEVIPGVSSFYAAAAYAGIPVTHRKAASSFHVITGHEDPAKESSVLDYATLAQEEGTLVFLMGLSRIGTICRMLIENGKNPSAQAAVIASGTTSRQRCITAPLQDIAEYTKQEGIRPPAVLMVGEVVSLQPKIAWQQQGPLSGRRILVTASGAIAGRLGKMITDFGGEPVLLSLIDVKLLENICLKSVLEQAEARAWLVFTSRNGVQLFFEQMKKEKIDLRLLGGKRIAVIGNGTAKALEAHGFYADLIPEAACSDSLAEALCRKVKKDQAGAQVLMFRAEGASAVLSEKLQKAGIRYVDTALYRTEHQLKKAALLGQLLDDVDAVTFCSASAVDAFCGMTEGREQLPKIVCIGPVTAGAVRKKGMQADASAGKYDLNGLVQSLCDIMNKEKLK